MAINKYKHLTPEMRKIAKRVLDKGEATPDAIRHNILEMETLECLERAFGKDTKPIIVEGNFFWNGKMYDQTLGGELMYFVDRWEEKHKEK